MGNSFEEEHQGQQENPEIKNSLGMLEIHLNHFLLRSKLDVTYDEDHLEKAKEYLPLLLTEVKNRSLQLILRELSKAVSDIKVGSTIDEGVLNGIQTLIAEIRKEQRY